MEEGFKPYLRGINKWDKTVRTELRKELRASAEMIASGSRLLADAHSRTIEVKVRTGIQSERAEVQIRGTGGPIAGLFELGNKGGGKSRASTARRKFRHPLFGDKGKWYDQDMHPYIAPIVKLRIAAVTKRVKTAVERANKTLARF